MSKTKSIIPMVPIDELRRLYYDEGLSTTEIGSRIGRCESLVYTRLNKAGYKLRGKKEAGIRSTTRQFPALELRGITTELIKQLYIENKLSGPEIAKQLGCSSATIQRRLKEIGCPTRSPQEAKQLSYKKYPPLIGREHPSWTGGRSVVGKGYMRVYAPNHHRAVGNYVLEHIFVWERTHNRLLPKGWVIHHLNGIKTDNRPENLAAMSKEKHGNLAEPYKKRIRMLEIDNQQLRHALEDSQMIFYINEN